MKVFMKQPWWKPPLGVAVILASGMLACAIPITDLQTTLKTDIDIISGDNQTGFFGETLPEPIVVRVRVGGEPANGLMVNWWVILPRVGPHTLSDLCGYAWNDESGNGTTITDDSGRSSNGWRGRIVREPVEPQDCAMRIQVRSEELDLVVAEDTVYARWESSDG